MFVRNLLFAGLAMLAACGTPANKNPHVEINTRLGTIEVELYPDKAPKSVAAFLLYVKDGLYTDGSFYRVLNMDNQPSDAPKAEVIQGGIWKKKGVPELPGIPHETTQQTGIKHTNGVLSFARLEPGTAKTEFFICIGDQPGFDYGGDNNPDGQGYAAFGKVVKGMDVVMKIYRQPESGQYFESPVMIYGVR